jgi:hypothetical protein
MKSFMSLQICRAMVRQVHLVDAFPVSKKKRRSKMKSNLIRTLLSTAALLSLSVAANAQNYIGANIPFSFRMNGTALPAGTYRLSRPTTSGNVLLLRGAESAVYAMGLQPSISEEKRPRLVFACGDINGCRLAEVWIEDGRGWKLAAPRTGPVQKEQLAVVYIDRGKVAE